MSGDLRRRIVEARLARKQERRESRREACWRCQGQGQFDNPYTGGMLTCPSCEGRCFLYGAEKEKNRR